MGTAVARKKAPGRRRMGVPPGNILNLAGIDRIRGYGDSMNIPGMMGEVAIDSPGSPRAQAEEALSAGGVEHVPADNLIVDKASGQSQVLIQPMHLNGALLNGVPSPSEEMGVVLGERRYFFNTYLVRGGTGQWAPAAGAPARHQWYVVDKEGRPQPPDVVKQVFDLLLKGVELYYRRFYRDFVLAELSWFNNAVMEFEEGAALASSLRKSGKQPTKAQEETIATFYKARFSGHMKPIREGEALILEWLASNPAA